ncbi:zinc finger protein 420-like isoform X2 [Littorina saxatilis]|uniref:zinc finger protein 420-like isoform X2 n=1 Tax=Littorina saxatilis TaxID=31220 RepID=UPI0038B616E5
MQNGALEENLVPQNARHLDIASDIISRFRSVGTRQGLTSDTEIAEYLLHLHKEREADQELAAWCNKCEAKLVLYCENCGVQVQQSHGKVLRLERLAHASQVPTISQDKLQQGDFNGSDKEDQQPGTKESLLNDVTYFVETGFEPASGVPLELRSEKPDSEEKSKSDDTQPISSKIKSEKPPQNKQPHIYNQRGFELASGVSTELYYENQNEEERSKSNDPQLVSPTRKSGRLPQNKEPQIQNETGFEPASGVPLDLGLKKSREDKRSKPKDSLPEVLPNRKRGRASQNREPHIHSEMGLDPAMGVFSEELCLAELKKDEPFNNAQPMSLPPQRKRGRPPRNRQTKTPTEFRFEPPSSMPEEVCSDKLNEDEEKKREKERSKSENTRPVTTRPPQNRESYIMIYNRIGFELCSEKTSKDEVSNHTLVPKRKRGRHPQHRETHINNGTEIQKSEELYSDMQTEDKHPDNTQARSPKRRKRGRPRKSSESLSDRDSTSRPVCCSVCMTSVSRARDLKVHMRVHTGEMPYACHDCDKRFRYRNSYKYHLKFKCRRSPSAVKETQNCEQVKACVFQVGISEQAKHCVSHMGISEQAEHCDSRVDTHFSAGGRTQESESVIGNCSTLNQDGQISNETQSQKYKKVIESDGEMTSCEKNDISSTRKMLSNSITEETLVPYPVAMCAAEAACSDLDTGQRLETVGRVKVEVKGLCCVEKDSDHNKVSFEVVYSAKTTHQKRIDSDHSRSVQKMEAAQQQKQQQQQDKEQLHVQQQQDIHHSLHKPIPSDSVQPLFECAQQITKCSCKPPGPGYPESCPKQEQVSGSTVSQDCLVPKQEQREEVKTKSEGIILSEEGKGYAVDTAVPEERKGYEVVTSLLEDRPRNCELVAKETDTEDPPPCRKRGRQPRHPNKSVACKICGAKISRQRDLKIHMRVHSGEKPFLCSECGQAFRHASGLASHRTRRHSAKQPFMCDQCGAAFHLIGSLNQHMQTHADARPHECQQCGKAFSRPSDLRAHVQRHLKVKHFSCDVCSKRFFTRGELTSHRLVHTSEKRHMCTECRKEFRLPKSLKRHMQRHLVDLALYCAACKKSFASREDFSFHCQWHAQGGLV